MVPVEVCQQMIDDSLQRSANISEDRCASLALEAFNSAKEENRQENKATLTSMEGAASKKIKEIEDAADKKLRDIDEELTIVSFQQEMINKVIDQQKIESEQEQASTGEKVMRFTEIGETPNGTAEALRLQARNVRAFMSSREQELEAQFNRCNDHLKERITEPKQAALSYFGAAASQQSRSEGGTGR